MSKNNLILTIVISLLLLVSLFLFNNYYQHSIKQVSTDAEKADSKTSESDKLLENNKKAIEEASKSVDLGPRPISKDDHVRGDLSAEINMIAYMDYSCTFCADLAYNLNIIIEEYNDKIVLAVRHFPMRSNTDSFTLALALECSDEQNSYWNMHDAVYESIRVGTSSSEMYLNIAREFDLDEADFNKCLTNENAAEKINEQMADAKTIGVIGTPTLYINNEIYPGAVPLDDYVDSQGNEKEGLRSIIERLLSQLKIEN